MTARLFVGDAALEAGSTMTLPDEAAHHALRVLRLRVGDALVLFDGRGGEWRATLASAGRRGEDATVAVERHDAVERESPLAVALAMSTIATDAMDYAVRKAVELGCASIAPVVASRSQGASHRDTRVEHWRRIAIAACEQCGRNRVPLVPAVRELSEWLLALRGGTALPPELNTFSQERYLLSLGPAAQLLSAVGAVVAPMILLSGPEGGLSPAEETAAREAGFQPVTLGPRVLRAETAPLVALSRWAG